MRKFIPIVFIISIVTLAIFLAYRYFNIGSVVVTTTAEQAIITIKDMGGKTIKETEEGDDKLQVELVSGSYVVVVTQSKGYSSGAERINIKPHETTTLHIKPNQAIPPEPVISKDASGLNINNNSLTYIDTNTKQLTTIAQDSKISEIRPEFDNSDFMINDIKWASSHHAAIVDEDYNLWEFQNNILTKIPIPKDINISSFAITEKGRIYISTQHDIYEYSNRFSKVYSTKNSIITIDTSSQGILSLESKEEDSEVNHGPGDGSLVFIKDKKHIYRKDIGDIDSNPVLSKSSPVKIAYKSSIFNEKLEEIGHLNSLIQSSSIWNSSADLLFYTNDNQVWKYDTKTQQSTLIGRVLPGSSISNLAITPTGDYLYFTINNSTGSESTPFIGRLGLTKSTQEVSSYKYGLNILLPKNTQHCTVSYINFFKPTIKMSGEKEEVCTNETTELLSDLRLPESQFQYSFTQTTI